MVSTELQTFFTSVNSEASLQALIEQKAKESLYLEYKTEKNRTEAELDKSDAWQFSRALSGFANSDGGILIWGIESNKQEEAGRLKPISAVNDFHGRLKKSLLGSTQPVVDGVQLDVIPTSADPDAGYVKCLIPSSDKTPHRAMLAEREYFKRTTEGFYRLERDAHGLAAKIDDGAQVILLGSIASGKYVDILLPIFRERLKFPAAFAGLGDMSRGGLMLRAARARTELEYVSLDTPRHADGAVERARQLMREMSS